MALRYIVLWGLLVLIACHGVKFAVGDEIKYCYNNTATNCAGPEKWPGLCKTGGNQSGVGFPKLYNCFGKPNITTTLILSKECSEPQNFTLTNDEYKVKMGLHKGCFITGGLVNGETIKCTNITFHWGSTKNEGSEHRLDGDLMAMEAHICCHNIRYANIPQAMMSGVPGAVKCFAVLFRESYSSNNNESQAITGLLDRIPFHGNTVQGGGFNLSHFIDVDYNRGKLDCMRYLGSPTFPIHGNCSEIVEWFIKRVTVYILKGEKDKFLGLKGEDGELIKNNCRETQRELKDGEFECRRMYPVIEGKERQGSTLRPGILPPLPAIIPNKFLPSL